MDLRFTTLGSIALTVDGVVRPIAGRRERSVLALLLAARGRVVSVDRLIADVWGDSAADSARGSLQVAISRLRSLIEPDRAAHAPARILVSRSPGYALLTRPGSVDSDEFADLVARSHSAMDGDSVEAAVAFCDMAIEKWTGPPFGSESSSGLIRAEAARLDDLLVSALTVRAEAMLRLGRHDLMTGELESLVAAHPWNERLRELQVLALYRAGRQRDALAELRQAREVFVDELGIDPSPTLQRLEADILAQEPGLDAPWVRTSTPPANGVATPPFTGREAELAGLVKMLDVARAGRSTGVIISGGPGIGKTRLVAELIDIAQAHDVKVLVGACQGADVSPPYWPWIRVVREIASSWPDLAASELLTPQSAGGDASSITLRTYEAVTDLVAEAAGRSPLLIVLEDIQWADASSLRLLAHALPLLSRSRVLLVATVRDTSQPSEQLLACLAELGRQSTQRIHLSGLTVGQIGALITRWTGVDDAELAAEVASRTDGNPFYVMELVRLLRTEDRLNALGASEIHVPHGVQDVLRARLALLPGAVGRLLRVAAVVGREFDLQLVCAVAGIPTDEALELLDQAVLAQAIEEQAKPGWFKFTHALVRETLAESLLATRRLFLHAAIGLALEPRLANDGDLIDDVAHHFVLGATVRPDVAGRAVEHSMAAARVAERRGVLDHALEHWQNAFAAEQLAMPQVRERRYEVLLGLGRARHRRGEVLGSGEALYEAIEIGRELGDVARMATAATSFRGAGVWNWREAGASDQSVITMLERCVADLKPGPLRARSLASLAMELTFAWRSAEADHCGLAAVKAARTIDDEDLLADVLQMRAQSLWGRPGAAAERLSLAGEVLVTNVSPEQELNTTFPAAAACMQLGQVARADEMVHRCVHLSRQLRHSGADVPIAHWLLHRAIAIGDRVGICELADAAMAIHRRSEVPALSELLVIDQIRCAPTGTVPDDDQLLAARSHVNPHFRAFIGHVLAEAGRFEAALEILGDPAPDGSWDYASTWGDCLRLDVLAYAGPSPELVRVLDRISPWGAEFAIGGSCDFIGSIEYFIGRGREGLGDIEGARGAYRRAVQRNAEARVLPWEIRAARRLAALPRVLVTKDDG